MNDKIFNVSGYFFTTINQPDQVASEISALAESLSIKGSFILSTEGFNFFIAGSQEFIEKFLCECPLLSITSITLQKSWSDFTPFRRFQVKVRPEIVTTRSWFGPLADQETYVAPTQFYQWLSCGKAIDNRPMVVLDVRNQDEIAYGTFDNAVHLSIDKFADFFVKADEWLANTPIHIRENQAIVTVCTGNIRCEKAVPYLISRGCRHIYQLQGGILQYFKQVGGAYYQGECFVFDTRITVTADTSLYA